VLDQPTEATFEYFLAEQAIARIRQAASGHAPFFLGLHFFGPHLPYCIPADHYYRYDRSQVSLPASMAETFTEKPLVQRHYSGHWSVDHLGAEAWHDLIAAYWGYVSLIDAQIGRVNEALEEAGLADDTAVLFSADHGEFTGAHRLHDKGPAMYDDIYRVPLLGRIPGGAPGRVEDRFSLTTDLTATILDIAGVDIPEHYDGASLGPLLQGEDVSRWREEVVAEFHGHHFPYPQRMIRTRRHKLVINPPDVNELYDLLADPDELENRYEETAYADVRDELMRRLYVLLRERGDNFYHWMTSMFDVGGKTYDAALSALDRNTRP
jgi:arylsulfatase A-like enzyme